VGGDGRTKLRSEATKLRTAGVAGLSGLPKRGARPAGAATMARERALARSGGLPGVQPGRAKRAHTTRRQRRSAAESRA